MAYVMKAFGHFQYSFTVTLFNSDTSSVDHDTNEVVDVPKQLLIFKESVRNRKLQSTENSNVIMTKYIGGSPEYKTPFILYITDLTTYEIGQPLLELNLDISSAFSDKAQKSRILLQNEGKQFVDIFKSYRPNVIHLSFKSRGYQSINNRQIEMPLPPLETFSLSFNLDRMIRKESTV